MTTPAPKRVLCLIAPGFEEIETTAPVDLLRRAGADVVLASITSDTIVKGRSNIAIQPDIALSNIADAELRSFDLLLLPGGPGYQAMRADGRARDQAKAFVSSGRPVAAICAAPTILHDAGLLSGRRYTAHFTVQTDLRDALLEERVVQDGLLITSRGAGTAVEFGLALVRELFGQQKANEVARAIMV